MAESDDEQFSVAAATAISKIEHVEIRELAFRLVASAAPARSEAMVMLDRNWTAGDHQTAIEWFKREEDRDVRHAFGIHLRHFWEHHPDPGTESEMLLTLYAHGPCSTCRDFLLGRLIELDRLPQAVREECAYDANEDIRRMFVAEGAAT